MVDGTTSTATTTTTHMLSTTSSTATTTAQMTASNMSELFHKQHNSTLVSMESSNEEIGYPCPDLVISSRNSEVSDDDFASTSKDNTKIRLPSGKTISRKPEGPHTSKHRHRRTPSPATSSPLHTSRKVSGNCAMISDPVTVRTSIPSPKSRHSPTPPTSDSEDEHSDSSLRHLQSSSNSLTPHIRLQSQRTTIRSSDAQMLASLPVSSQRTLLATTRKAVEGAVRQEQEYRRKLDGYGNLKSKERFVNDVPGGKSHKNRFFAQ